MPNEETTRNMAAVESGTESSSAVEPESSSAVAAVAWAVESATVAWVERLRTDLTLALAPLPEPERTDLRNRMYGALNTLLLQEGERAGLKARLALLEGERDFYRSNFEGDLPEDLAEEEVG